MVILDLAVEQSKILIEMLNPHIIRENQVVFLIAKTCLFTEALDVIKNK